MSDKLTAELDRIEKLADAATPEPWFSVCTDDQDFMNARYVGTVNRGGGHDGQQGLIASGERVGEIVAITLAQAPELVSIADEKYDENMDFIADARTSNPRMVRLIRAQDRVIRAWQQVKELLAKQGEPMALGLLKAAVAESSEAESALAELLAKEWA